MSFHKFQQATDAVSWVEDSRRIKKGHEKRFVTYVKIVDDKPQTKPY